MKLSLPILKFLILLSSVALGVGMTAPTITITPGAGDLTPLIELLAPDELDTRSYSIIGMIGKLIEAEDWFLAVTLFIFSILFPTTKLGFYWLSATRPTGRESSRRFLKGIDHFGKFSMAEVFLLALTIFALKDLPGGTGVQIQYGFYVFFPSVLLSLLISIAMGKTTQGPSKNEAEEEEEETA